jgi:AcrR family transcriptional regulator
MALLQQRSFEDITLDQVAAGAGVTRQTVIRRFGDKLGPMRETSRVIGEKVREARWRPAADPAGAVAMLVRDYERTGDLVVDILARRTAALNWARCWTWGAPATALGSKPRSDRS